MLLGADFFWIIFTGFLLKVPLEKHPMGVFWKLKTQNQKHRRRGGFLFYKLKL